MEHQEAIQLRATERYLLGDLAGDIREQFEEHYFSCVECARDVEAGAAFIDAAREMLAKDSPVETVTLKQKAQPRRWFNVFLRPAVAVPVMATLLVAAVYQNAYVIPRMRGELAEANAPRVLQWHSLIAENSRGGEPMTITAPPNTDFGLFLDIPPEKHFPAYTCDFETQSGSPEFSIRVSANQAAQNLQLLIPSSRLGPGKHVLVVRGAEAQTASAANESEVARFEFTLELSK